MFRTDLGRWRFFGDVSHERSFHCTAMAWVSQHSDPAPFLLLCCDLKPSDHNSLVLSPSRNARRTAPVDTTDADPTYSVSAAAVVVTRPHQPRCLPRLAQLRVYRGRSLDNDSVVAEYVLGAPVVLLDVSDLVPSAGASSASSRSGAADFEPLLPHRSHRSVETRFVTLLDATHSLLLLRWTYDIAGTSSLDVCFRHRATDMPPPHTADRASMELLRQVRLSNPYNTCSTAVCWLYTSVAPFSVTGQSKQATMSSSGRFVLSPLSLSHSC